MATTVVKRKPKRRSQADKAHQSAQRQARHLIKHKLTLVAASLSPSDIPDADAAETMQWLLNRTTLLWRAASAEVDLLTPGLSRDQRDALKHELWRSWDEQGNSRIEANFWVQQEERLRQELARLTESAQKLGLSERRARVAEAQLQLLGEALKAACKQAGIGTDQQRLLGAALRAELTTIEGTATEKNAA